MADPLNTYNLERLMSLYETFPYKNSDEDKRLAHKIISVMIVGMNHLNHLQLKSLEKFIERISGRAPDEHLIAIAKSIFINRVTEVHMCRELYIKTHAFRMTSMINEYSRKDKKDFLLHVTSMISKASTGECPMNMEGLNHCSKVFRAPLDEKLLKKLSETSVLQSLKTLLQKIPTQKASPSKIEFQESACIAIKKMEESLTPEEIVKHRAFHGNALKSAIKKVEETYLKNSFKATTISDLVSNYCNEKIGLRQYMIRHSSRTYQQEGDFFFTISYKKEDGTVHHHRAARKITPKGKIEWYWSNTKGVLGKNAFDSIDNLISSHHHIQNYFPAPITTEDEVYEILNQRFLESSGNP